MVKIVTSSAAGESRARVRMSASDIALYFLKHGGFVGLKGKRESCFRVEEDLSLDAGTAALDPVGMENLGIREGEDVSIHCAETAPASRVTLRALNAEAEKAENSDALRPQLRGRPVSRGDVVETLSPQGLVMRFRAVETLPLEHVVISDGTVFCVEIPEARQGTISYGDIGGLSGQLRRIREMIELPLKHPGVFQRLKTEPPRGVLLYGPPGTGKTMIAKAVAQEADAWFTSISGPEIIGKYYGESEERLRAVFDEAKAKAPAIIFIDEIDAIAPKREEMSGEKQVERRVVAQLLTLMDGLSSRGQVIVIAATNIPNTLDPALRRPGRFDREISVPIPDRDGRLEILKIHTRGMPLAEDVSLSELADATHGFVGADLQALAKEGAMAALRRAFPSLEDVPSVSEEDLRVSMADFRSALREIEASAIREVFSERPQVRWNQIGGLASVKKRLEEAVQWPLKHGELFRKWGVTAPRGIMLHGPAGTGKTLLVKALACESSVNFITVQGPALLSRYIGESEKALRDVFRTARQAAPCILYFDELDALVPPRGAGTPQSAVRESVVSQFLSEMRALETCGGVSVIAAVRRLDRVDPALFSAGRFDLILEVPMPKKEEAEEIFAIHLRPFALEGVAVASLASRAGGMSGGDIAALCRAAAMNALRETVASGGDTVGDAPSLCLRKAHFDAAFAEWETRRRAFCCCGESQSGCEPGEGGEGL